MRTEWLEIILGAFAVVISIISVGIFLTLLWATLV